jgi:methionine-S-sulfoxide reductase
VGYSGGTKENPTYHRLGDHTEAIQIDYDPEVISYKELLDIFWCSHHPTRRAFSRQYMSMIFYHDEQQKKLAMETKEARERELGAKIHTEIREFDKFYRAEDYHQKYALRQQSLLADQLKAIYPDAQAFTDSTAAARLNGFVYGYGTKEGLDDIDQNLGLSPQAADKLKSHVQGRLNSPHCS